MKKYFMFVAVAAAGMLASCSSESLTAGSDPKIEPTQEDRVAIEIGVATPQLNTSGTTRSVGTVGGSNNDNTDPKFDNYWHGEKVNVFMFEKGSLTLATDGTNNLYNDVALTTPAAVDKKTSGIANELTTGDSRIVYKYYPATGNFDFWGYYADDAATGAATIGASDVKVPFSIKGCQDLMVAKAEPTAADQAIIDAAAFGDDKTRFYSAYAARRNVQPNMIFKHLLTRFTFSVVGKDNDACGFNGGGILPATGVYTGVFIKSIKVKSKQTGNIIAAYTGDPKDTKDLIEFTGDAVPLPLGTSRGARTPNQVDSLYDQNVFTAAKWADNTEMATLLTIGGANWAAIMRPTSTTVANPIGGALLVQPLVTDGETTYDLEVELGQYLLVEDSYPTPGTSPKYEVHYATAKTKITPTKVNGTTQGVSYNVKITLYGFEKIEITTTLQPWASGTEITYDAE